MEKDLKEMDTGIKTLTLKCKDCGDSFMIERGEILFYAHKKLQLPSRCRCCRILRRVERLERGGESR